MAAILLTAAPAEAHDPLFLTDRQTTPESGPLLPDGTISFALYGRLEAPLDRRAFQVAFREGDRLLVELLIPDRPPENGFAAEDLPVARVTAPDGSTTDMLPEIGEPFDEPFSGTRYVRLARLEGAARAGVYDVVVTGPVPARFTVAVGTTERFATPVERVENRATAFAAVAGPLRDWYDTPPAVAPSPSQQPATTVAVPGAPSPADQSTATTQSPSVLAGDDGGEVDAGDGTIGAVVLLFVFAALAVIGGVIATLVRRRDDDSGPRRGR